MSYPPPINPGPPEPQPYEPAPVSPGPQQPYEPAHFAPPPAPKKSNAGLIIGVAVAVVAVAFGALLVVRTTGAVPAGVPLVGKDTGIAACEAIAEDNELAGNSPDETLIVEEYKRVRKMFSDSRHDAIRDNGVKIIDIVWQMRDMKDEDALAALAALPLVGTMMEAYAGLAGGCAEHGITIPPITSGT
ncbi:hypothetical protein RB614_03010 [Phytohabitans sp. ZYX-F-186]|uniref:Uncharacterized protein n=1 Tax=Phytohabitans maris TaxID=3071409 RepID=A0ABU0ZAY2_9ACTN|nr:hypothetical protein [Phytohabitans sp. ZYX-F-186]MDQ7903482.1 hypothetical protein [Phytohabitans sp. ZYX-F-186]